jgi:hypothetical protein
MTAEREQNWQPITMLPMFTEVVTGMLDGAAEQQQLLASARPYSSLDHATLDRVERVYRDGLDGHEAFENQLARWQREHPGAEGGLAELGEQVGQLRPAYQRVLDLAAQQRDNTIEALMGKSDAQVGLEACSAVRSRTTTPTGRASAKPTPTTSSTPCSPTNPTTPNSRPIDAGSSPSWCLT